MLGELLARYLAGFKLNVSPHKLSLVGERGQRPFLEDYSGLAVSIAHAGYYAVAAVDDAAIGVDIERIAPVDPDEFLNMLPAAAMASLCSMEVNDSRKRICEVWTAHESYYKATGLYLPSEVLISLISDKVSQSASFFRTYIVDPDYCVTVYSITKHFAPRLALLSCSELLAAFNV